MTRASLCTGAFAFLLTAGHIAAHHSFASEYDQNKRVKVFGTVTSFQWINPHVMVYIAGTDASGKAAKWRFEMGSPNGLTSRGWKKSDLKKGDAITVQGFAAKDAEKMANATTVTLADGRKLFGGFKSTPGATASPAK